MPEIDKLRLPENARVLNTLGNLWLAMAAAAVLSYLFYVGVGNGAVAAADVVVSALSSIKFYVLSILALSPGIGVKIWARQILKKSVNLRA